MVRVLLVAGVIAGGAALVGGLDYYLMPLAERPFSPSHDLYAPTGLIGQGFGVIGTLMIALGVGGYALRKRLRRAGAGPRCGCCSPATHSTSLHRAGLLGHARRLKGAQRPVLPACERAELVASLACVDWVAIFRDDTPLSLIRALRPDVLAKGGDWPLDSVVGAEDVLRRGGRVASLQEVPGVRSSIIIERLQCRDGEGG